MLLKLLLISVVLVALMVLAFGVKLLLEPGSELEAHSCALENGRLNEDGTCSACHVTKLIDCHEHINKE
jgi:cytochrome c553